MNCSTREWADSAKAKPSITNAAMKPKLKLVDDTGSELPHDANEVPAEPQASQPQQAEMPFAMVEGEPYTEMPRDLYIPPDALQVFLEAFEGPLDLLLYLIRKQNLNILDIPIAEITRQYMGYIDVMQELQLELAGEYLLMAAMLAEIKSRMLLPRSQSEDGQEEDDPRAELVRRLQEYERFKKAADDLDQLKRMERDAVPAMVELVERKVIRLQPEVTLDEMLKAFREVVGRSEHFSHHHVQRERLSQRQRMTEILEWLESAEFVEFVRLFKPEEGRMGVTVTFIAILELMKEGLLDIVQSEPYAPLHVRKAGHRQQTIPVATADEENAAALAQPELVDENVVDDDGAEEGATAEATDETAAHHTAAEVSTDLNVDELIDALINEAEQEKHIEPTTDEHAEAEESATELIDGKTIDE